jgi:hypothetical protein
LLIALELRNVATRLDDLVERRMAGELFLPLDWPLLAEFIAWWSSVDDQRKELFAASVALSQIMNLPKFTLPPSVVRIAELAYLPLADGFPDFLRSIPAAPGAER